MGRITNTGDTPAKQRHAHIRSCAEALRLLAQNPHLGLDATATSHATTPIRSSTRSVS